MALADLDLVTLAKAARRSDAFDTLVRRHQGSLRAFLTRLSGDVTQADDLAQETFIKAFRSIDQFQGGASFRSWLFAIGVREFLQAKRKTDAGRKLKDSIKNDFSRESKIAAPPELSLDLQSALATLDNNERTSVLLCDAAGFSHAEAATAMAAPLGSVKTYVARGRGKLRVILSGGAESPGRDAAAPNQKETYHA